MSIGATLFDGIFDQAMHYTLYFVKALNTVAPNWQRSFVVLYIVIVGIQLIKGVHGDKSKEWLSSIVYLAIFQVVVVETSSYFSWIVLPIIGTVFDIASWVTTMSQVSNTEGGIAGIFSALDTALFNIFAAIENLDPDGNIITDAWLYIKIGSVSLSLGMAYCAIYFTFFGLLLISFLMLVVLFVLGPFFLFFICWKETRFLAIAWIRAVSKYALLAIIGSIAISMTIFMIRLVTNDIANIDVSDGVFTKEVGSALLVAVTALYLLLKAPDIAADLTGGSAGNTAILSASLGMAGGAIMKNSQAAWNSKAGKAGRKFAWDKVQGGAGAAYSYGLDTAQRIGRAYSARKGVSR